MEIERNENGKYELRDESGKSVGNSYTGTDFYSRIGIHKE